MKLPFKVIATLIVLSLAGIFAYQAYWLTDLYSTLKKELEDKIMLSVRRSDYNEMVCRIQTLQREERHGEISSIVTQSADTVTVVTQTTEESNEQDAYVESTTATLTASPFTTIIKQNNNLELLALSVQKGIHSALDDYIEINIQVYDSLLTESLREDGITTPHLTELINMRDSTIEATCTNDSMYVPTNKALVFDYSFNLNNKHLYRVRLEPIDSIVWKQMTGILLTSAAIVLLLAFSFYYLIHTILRQKTLEEMKADFTNNITHELKTPLAVAYAANDAMLNFEQTEVKRKEYMQVIQNQLKHLSELIEHILSMSMESRKNFRLHPEAINLEEMIDSLTRQHTLKADKPVEFSVKYATHGLIIHADRVHLYNVLSNLLDNAIKYSRDSAQVDISVWKTPEGIKLSVKDKGIGIPADKLELIYDRFYRVPTGNLHDVKGYGLGLYYVKTMVEKHGGTITVQSTPGKGSEFTIQIPG